MSLIQVLGAAALMFLMIYVMITLLIYSARQQQMQTMLANAVEIQKKLSNLLTDPSSWAQTLGDAVNNTTMNCLRAKTTCSALDGLQNRIHTIYDAGGGGASNILITNTPEWLSPTYPSGGFTPSGQPCSTFNGADSSGVDACPFSYKISWEPYCAASPPSCIDPAIRITARFIYNPSTNPLSKTPIRLGNPDVVLAIASDDSTKSPVNATATSNIPPDPDRQIHDPNNGKHDVVVWRTASSNMQAFRAVISTTVSPGNCVVGTMTARVSWSEATSVGGSDPFDLISVSADRITFRKKGTYVCDVSAVGKSVKGFNVSLKGVGDANAVGSATGYAPVGIQSTAEFDTSFTTSIVDKEFEVLQSCEETGTGDGLGGVATTGDSTVLASVSCHLVD